MAMATPEAQKMFAVMYQVPAKFSLA